MKRRALFAFGIGLLVAPKMSFSATAEIFTGLVDGVGAGGYDVVSYHTEAAGKPGNATYSFDWKGAKWYFISPENLALFVADPEKYAPQYGGYCAYAVAKNGTAKGDPEAWTVVDGKLYLNLSKSVQSLWSKDIAGNISKANENWPKVLQ